MIWEVFGYVGMQDYFGREHILGLADPGPGIQADKGSEAQIALDALGITETSQCILADDKLTNLNWAYTICDTLWIQERAGMDGTDMNCVEARMLSF